MAVAFCALISHELRDTAISAVAAFFYVNNWAQLFGRLRTEATGPFWSLSVEEQFYFFLPLLLIGLYRFARFKAARPQRTVVVALAAVTLVDFGWKCLLLAAGVSVRAVSLRTDTRADGLLLGCTVAAILLENPNALQRIRRSTALAVVSLASLVVLFRISSNLTTSSLEISMPLASVCSVLLILFLLDDPKGRFAWLFTNRLAVHFGEISYSLYLWHQIWTAWPGWNHRSQYVVLGGLAMLAMISAEVSYYVVEKPLRTRGRAGLDRWISSRPARSIA